MPIAIDEGVSEALYDYSHVPITTLCIKNTPKVMWMNNFPKDKLTIIVSEEPRARGHKYLSQNPTVPLLLAA
jgi:hypothetical protein